MFFGKSVRSKFYKSRIDREIIFSYLAEIWFLYSLITQRRKSSVPRVVIFSSYIVFERKKRQPTFSIVNKTRVLFPSFFPSVQNFSLYRWQTRRTSVHASIYDVSSIKTRNVRWIVKVVILSSFLVLGLFFRVLRSPIIRSFANSKDFRLEKILLHLQSEAKKVPQRE